MREVLVISSPVVMSDRSCGLVMVSLWLRKVALRVFTQAECPDTPAEDHPRLVLHILRSDTQCRRHNENRL